MGDDEKTKHVWQAEAVVAWIRQAERDLEVARRLEALGYFEWTCYASQQSAEKALKATHVAFGVNPEELQRFQKSDGHDLVKLLGLRATESLKEAASLLNAHNTQARYPMPGAEARAPLAPYEERYDAAKAATSIGHAELLVAHARRIVATLDDCWAR